MDALTVAARIHPQDRVKGIVMTLLKPTERAGWVGGVGGGEGDSHTRQRALPLSFFRRLTSPSC